MGTLRAFIRHANSPKTYIIGRCDPAAGSLLRDPRLLNPLATLNFLDSEASLMKEADRICDQIKIKEEKVDFVFLSAGYLSFDGRMGSSPQRLVLIPPLRSLTISRILWRK